MNEKEIIWFKSLSNDEIKKLVSIGFCQPKFYKPSVWKEAKRVMEIAVSKGIAQPYDFGRGKGKYTSKFEIDEVASKLISIRNES